MQDVDERWGRPTALAMGQKVRGVNKGVSVHEWPPEFAKRTESAVRERKGRESSCRLARPSGSSKPSEAYRTPGGVRLCNEQLERVTEELKITQRLRKRRFGDAKTWSARVPRGVAEWAPREICCERRPKTFVSRGSGQVGSGQVGSGQSDGSRVGWDGRSEEGPAAGKARRVVGIIGGHSGTADGLRPCAERSSADTSTTSSPWRQAAARPVRASWSNRGAPQVCKATGRSSLRRFKGFGSRQILHNQAFLAQLNLRSCSFPGLTEAECGEVDCTHIDAQASPRALQLALGTSPFFGYPSRGRIHFPSLARSRYLHRRLLDRFMISAPAMLASFDIAVRPLWLDHHQALQISPIVNLVEHAEPGL
ncbi:hypothetical protein E2P81_ATG04419 [Venturia nashicola]|nr:hypothetical protein E2P81_ATG04419 [Venturia nashicola]